MFWFIITVVLVITFRKEIVSLFSPIGAFVSNIAGRIKEKITPTPEQAAIKAKEKEVKAKFVRNLSETEELYSTYAKCITKWDWGKFYRIQTSDGNFFDRSGTIWQGMYNKTQSRDLSLVVTRDENGKIINKEYFPIKAEIYY